MTATAQESPPSSRESHYRATPASLFNILFTTSILLSALLLFAVQPMVSKMLLPPYGGAAAVWTTSLLFFQTVLLIGYAYSHFAPRLLGRFHPAAHAVLVLIPLLVLPIALPTWAAPDGSVPVAGWLLLVLAVMVGLPFAVLSTTGPLIQAWYSDLNLPRSRDPYFLYAASNVGSLGALVAYPFLAEPLFGLEMLTTGWAVGYGVFAFLMIACAAVTVVRRRALGTTAPSGIDPPLVDTEDAYASSGYSGSEAPPAATRPITMRRRLLWLALAALPSSLMQGATTFISTDVAPVPLLWVAPLALFLGTYIVAFGVRRHKWVAGACDTVLILTIPVLLLALMPAVLPVWAALLSAFVMLGATALACHGLLAADRPAPERLTEFFLINSLGGALGSLFNGVIAPLVFDQVLEYPLVIAAAALLVVAAREPSRLVRRLKGKAPFRIAVLLIGAAGAALLQVTEASWLSVPLAVVGGIAALLIIGNRTAQGVVFAAFSLALISYMQFLRVDTAVHNGRTFFGAYRISETEKSRELAHGTTVHGFQMLDNEQSSTPVSYYSETGPVGDLFTAYGDTADDVAVVGLGTGVMAAYGEQGQRYDFYEIDPAMVELSTDSRWFTYLDDCACEVRTIVGDGRLEIGEADEGAYDIVVLDAFTSDAIPTHMLTVEALRTFADRLGPDGVLAIHISNRNLRLAPMLGATAERAGLSGNIREDFNVDENGDEVNELANASEWVVLANEPDQLSALTDDDAPHGQEWEELPTSGPVWTDGYSSLVGVLRFQY